MTTKETNELELERARRRGRRAGVIVFALLVGGVTAIFAVQILIQVYTPSSTEASLACRPGVEALFAAVSRARKAASEATGGERDALHRFRAALGPEWSFRPALDERCAGDPESAQRLVVLDKLRYAEEHAVRYEAASLSALRRQAGQLGRAAPTKAPDR